MNKQQLIKKMAADAGITQTAAGAALDSFMFGTAEALADGEEVVLKGFGTFKPSERKARIARNPKTGDPVSVPAKTAIRFAAGKGLLATVN